MRPAILKFFTGKEIKEDVGKIIFIVDGKKPKQACGQPLEFENEETPPICSMYK